MNKPSDNLNKTGGLSWEGLLGRLNLSLEAASTKKPDQKLLQQLAKPLPFRTLLHNSVISMPKFFHGYQALAIRVGEGTVSLIEHSFTKTKALKFLEHPVVHQSLLSNSAAKRSIKGIFAPEDKSFFRIIPIGRYPSSYRLILLGSRPLKSAEENFTRLIADLLSLHHQTQLLREEVVKEAKSLALLTHHLSEGMVVLNRDLRVTLWNRPMQRLTGIAPKEAVGRHYSEVFRIKGGPSWLEELVGQYDETPVINVFSKEIEIIARDGSVRWVNVSGSFLRQNDQQITQTILIARDVSRLKMLEQRKNEFVSIATHELRTPITAIKGYLSLLAKDQGNLTDKQRTYLGRTIDANNRLSRLAEDLLKAVQVEEDRLRINLRPIELWPILEKVARDLSAKAAAKSIDISIDKPDFSTRATADEEKTEQVFANLLDNAIKYTNEGEIKIAFDLREQKNESYIVTSIQDTGIGISSKNYQAIFEKFRRTHNTGQIRESGAGLGLFIVKSFVEKQGGKINVHSRMGKGTTFTVSLPATEAVGKVSNKGEGNE